MTDRVPVAGPWITDREIGYVTQAATEAWYRGAGSWVARFEAAFAPHVQRRHAVALPSCTSALHLALLAAGVGLGDEVIVPDVTWIASAAPISYVGATPVFADIDEETWCLSVVAVERVVTDRTKAIIAVDLYGGMPDLPALEELATGRGIALIEDAAEAIGSSRAGRPAGSFGLASTFSFHGSKTLTTGEGGMLVTDDDELVARVRVLRDHGRRPGDTDFRNHEIGWKYKMTDLQAAVGVAQLERVDELVQRKRDIFGWYHERLSSTSAVTLNAEPDGVHNSYWMVTALVDPSRGLTKGHLRAELDARGIDSRPFFDPLSSLDAYAEHPSTPRARAENAISYELAPRGVNLPSALCLTESDVGRVCDALVDIIGS